MPKSSSKDWDVVWAGAKPLPDEQTLPEELLPKEKVADAGEETH